jgi:voltage-gated sodium channel
MNAIPRNRLARLVDSTPFTLTIVGVIGVNAVVLGLDTYAGVEERFGDTLFAINAICIGIFVCELVLRIASYGRRPWNFFRDGWNVFDFIVIGGAFVPGIRENATLLRLVRLGRIVRVVRLLPELRVLLAGVWRSVPPLLSIAVVTGMLLFVYGMVGWILFADELPNEWGNIGRAMLTLFVMLTLENFPVYMDQGMDVHPWSWVYFVTFVLIAAFVVINVLIGIVLNSMEEAREAEKRKAVRDRLGVPVGELADPDASAPVVERIALLRAALDELETELSVGHSAERKRPEPRPESTRS